MLCFTLSCFSCSASWTKLIILSFLPSFSKNIWSHKRNNNWYCSSSQDELEAHSTQGALSVFVHYGGDKTDNLMLMAQHDVVLTTYGVLSAAYKAVCVWHLPSPTILFLEVTRSSQSSLMKNATHNRIAAASFTGWTGIGLCLMKLTQLNLLKLKGPKQLLDWTQNADGALQALHCKYVFASDIHTLFQYFQLYW